jgi:hypothetical protein
MGRSSLLCSLLAACTFSPQLATDPPAGIDAAIPIDTVVTIDAVDGSSQVDTDGDRVDDSIDNCLVTPNLDQHDEDTDLLGDVCDPCPQLPSGIADGDGDGIGDACDPNPSTTGDQLIRFEAFAAPPVGALPSGWVSTTGAATDWTVINDDLVIDVAATTNARFLVFDTMQTHTRIDVGFELSANATFSPALTVLVDEDAAGQNAMACSTRVGGGPGPGLLLERFASGSFTAVTQANETPVVPGSYRNVATIDATGHACDLVTASGSHPLTTAARPTRTHVGIRVRDLTARIHYVAVYTSP